MEVEYLSPTSVRVTDDNPRKAVRHAQVLAHRLQAKMAKEFNRERTHAGPLKKNKPSYNRWKERQGLGTKRGHATGALQHAMSAVPAWFVQKTKTGAAIYFDLDELHDHTGYAGYYSYFKTKGNSLVGIKPEWIRESRGREMKRIVNPTCLESMLRGLYFVGADELSESVPVSLSREGKWVVGKEAVNPIFSADLTPGLKASMLEGAARDLTKGAVAEARRRGVRLVVEGDCPKGTADDPNMADDEKLTVRRQRRKRTRKGRQRSESVRRRRGQRLRESSRRRSSRRRLLEAISSSEARKLGVEAGREAAIDARGGIPGRGERLSPGVDWVGIGTIKNAKDAADAIDMVAGEQADRYLEPDEYDEIFADEGTQETFMDGVMSGIGDYLREIRSDLEEEYGSSSNESRRRRGPRRGRVGEGSYGKRRKKKSDNGDDYVEPRGNQTTRRARRKEQFDDGDEFYDVVEAGRRRRSRLRTEHSRRGRRR